jgi:hypothetical protein
MQNKLTSAIGRGKVGIAHLLIESAHKSYFCKAKPMEAPTSIEVSN